MTSEKKTLKKKYLKELFKISKFDYKEAKLATVNFNGEAKYELMDMLDDVENIKIVIEDIKQGAWICPF